MSAPRCSRTAEIDRHFARALPPAGERLMREHLPTCAACRAHYEKHLLLERLDPDAAGPQARMASGLGIGAPRPGLRMATPIMGALALAAALAFLLARPAGSPLDPNAGFTARGGAGSGEAGAEAGRVTDGSYVIVHRSNDDAGSSRAGDSVRRNDELTFGYGNESNKQFLMIYGVDEHRHVFWYYPAWSDPQEDPRSIAIHPGAGSLPDSVRHDLDGAQLEIHAVFTDTPLTVKTVEGLISRAPVGQTPGFGPGAVDRTIRFQVKP